MLVTRVGSSSFTEATSTNITANQGASSGFATGKLTFAGSFFEDEGDELQVTVGSTEFRFIASDPVAIPADNSPVFFVSTGSSAAIAIDKLVAKIGTANALGAGITVHDGTTFLGISASLAGTAGNLITIETGSGAITADVVAAALSGGTDGSGTTAFTLKTLAEGSSFKQLYRSY